MCFRAEPSHLMYWNSFFVMRFMRFCKCWTVTFDVLKYTNCINVLIPCYCWTVTFDVLKLQTDKIRGFYDTAEPSHLMYWNTKLLHSLLQTGNRWTVTFDVLKCYTIVHIFKAVDSWTVTFDVLKFVKTPFIPLACYRWTVTFDVLKFRIIADIFCYYWLNRHIWCIEIKYAIFNWRKSHAEPSHLMYWNAFASVCLFISLYRWTVTFDVLKY